MNLVFFARALASLALGVASAAFAATNGSENSTKPSADREAFFRAQPSKPGEFRAAWIHSGYGVEGWGWDKSVGVLKSNGFNAILPNLAWAGLAHYPSRILPVSPKVAEQGDQIAECLKACRKYGVALHVWKVNHYLLHAPRDFVAGLRAEGRTQNNVKGEDVDWLCPSHPANFALERDSMLEVARAYDVDGLHFDYIRYPGREACFCAGCRERFENAIGVKLAKWPDDVLSGEHAERFGEWRRAQITRLVKAVSEEAHQLKPKLQVSAAVYGGWENARKSIGQDAKAWVEAGYLDFVCPMNYEPVDATFEELIRRQVSAVNHKAPLYIGIGAYKLPGPEQLVRQIQRSRALGADGFVLFQLNEKLATETLPLLWLGVTAERPPTNK
jgi:uncharacterized lipoprotein YddW (UPF0748 family)